MQSEIELPESGRCRLAETKPLPSIASGSFRAMILQCRLALFDPHQAVVVEYLSGRFTAKRSLVDDGANPPIDAAI
jgi:hypothetical protein